MHVTHSQGRGLFMSHKEDEAIDTDFGCVWIDGFVCVSSVCFSRTGLMEWPMERVESYLSLIL